MKPMKSITGLLGVLLALCLLGGCLSTQEKGTAYQVYFWNQEVGQGPALQGETRILPKEEDPVEFLLACLMEGPQEEGLSRTIPNGVTLKNWKLENGVLFVDFSSWYGSLSGIALTLADYSVVLTLTQLDGVEAVEITAGGEQLLYRDHQRLTAKDAWVVGHMNETGK